MKRKSLEDIFDSMYITEKRVKEEPKLTEKMYTQNEVDALLINQKMQMMQDFDKYIKELRSGPNELNIPIWIKV